MLGHLRIERRTSQCQHLAERQIDNDVRSTRKIERHFDQRLVEWVKPAGKPTNARLVAHGLTEGLSHCDANILHRVMSVDVQVARGTDGQVKAAVSTDLIEHVVEERQPRGYIGRARTVEVDRHRDVGLGGGPLHRATSKSRLVVHGSSLPVTSLQVELESGFGA